MCVASEWKISTYYYYYLYTRILPRKRDESAVRAHTAVHHDRVVIGGGVGLMTSYGTEGEPRRGSTFFYAPS